MEILEPLARRAEATLSRLGCRNVQIKIGDGYQGWPEHAPYDAIIVTCAPELIPQALLEQLRQGRRLVIPLGPESGPWSGQELVVARNTRAGLREEARMPVRFVPMTRAVRR